MIRENKSSRKIHRKLFREIKSTRNVYKMTRENKSTWKFLSLRYADCSFDLLTFLFFSQLVFIEIHCSRKEKKIYGVLLLICL